MTTLANQIERIQWLLQDTDTSPTRTSIIIEAHKESTQRLARKQAFPQIRWVNAIAAQSQYTLPADTVQVDHVLYNERTLRYATETALDRRFHGWEDLPDQPKYWTMDGQNPNVIRIVSAPTITGSLIPVIPSPLIMNMEDNLVVFLMEDLSEQMDDLGDDPIPTMLDWDDLLVWQTTRMLAERETTDQNLPVAQVCGQLESMWKQALGVL